MNERKVVGGNLCDLQKEFDWVNCNILLTKLGFYGVTGTTLKLIKSYLEGRYQKVILDDNLHNSNSDWGEIRHSVPQGSIISPVVFLLYINDLPKIFSDNAEIKSDIHNNTRNNLDLHYPQSHLSVYQNSAYSTGIKIFNRLPVPIKQLSPAQMNRCYSQLASHLINAS
jgi:hypothetical protein